jgi:hypothetical protein
MRTRLQALDTYCTHINYLTVDLQKEVLDAVCVNLCFVFLCNYLSPFLTAMFRRSSFGSSESSLLPEAAAAAAGPSRPFSLAEAMQARIFQI